MKYSSNWDGIPNNVDSAVQYSDGRSYFFKRGQYYKFDDETISVEEGDPGYPRDAGLWWFGCSETKSPLLFPPTSEKWKEIKSEKCCSWKWYFKIRRTQISNASNFSEKLSNKSMCFMNILHNPKFSWICTTKLAFQFPAYENLTLFEEEVILVIEKKQTDMG